MEVGVFIYTLFAMFSRFIKLFSPDFETLNLIEISTEKLLDNLHYLRDLHGRNNEVFPVLKSNAYGHGLKEIAKILKNTSVPYICVDSFPEYQIIKYYAQKPSLIMGETLPENYTYYNTKRAIPVVYNIDTIQWFIRQKNPFTIHVFLNTGMNREGFQINDLEKALRLLQKARHITLDGVMSHLADADLPDSNMVNKQVARFKEMYALIEKFGFSPNRKHIGSSAGLVKIFDEFFNAWRTGIAFYGYNILTLEDKVWDVFDVLKPILRITSKVISIQKIQKGEKVGYGNSFSASESMTVATIPFGYHEGLNRKLSNKRNIKWKDKQGKVHFLPLVGMVSMNYSTFDTLGFDIRMGDKIEVVSRNKHDPNTIQNFANTIETISYEVLVNIDPKMRRKIVGH